MTDVRYVFAFTSARPNVAAFYRDVLGLEVEDEKDDAVWFRTDGARFSVHDDEDRQTAKDVREAHAFVVGIGVDDLDAAYERVQGAGAVVGERFERWFFVRDPDGRFLIIAPKRVDGSRQASREASHLAADIVSFVANEPWSPWFTSLVKALAGVDHVHAGRQPRDGSNSIWATLNHVSFWHDLCLRRLRGVPSTDAEAVESGWSLPASGGPDEWAQARDQLLARNAAFARAIGELSASELDAPWGLAALRDGSWRMV